MSFDKIKPALVLFCLTGMVTATIIIAHDLTDKDESGMMTEELSSAVTEIYGEGNYSVVDKETLSNSEEIPENVLNIITDETGNLAFHIIQDAYNKDGLELVVGVKDGVTKGISFIAINETPGIGAKVDNKGFLSQFYDKSIVSIVDRPSNDNEIEAVTGATYSSKGVEKAVKQAIELEKMIGGGSNE